MGAFGWAEFVALVTSIGFGTISAVLPVVNAEAYVIASQVSAAAGPIPVAIGVALGQTVGKVLLFLGVRRGRDFPFVKHRRQELRSRPIGPTRARLRRWLAKLLALVGQKRWGLPIVLLAAVVGLPPLYAVALLAGATKMRLLWFALLVLVGRGTRFGLVATGFRGIHGWFI
jgi:membrane protein YqaA with SNARE-associated domain